MDSRRIVVRFHPHKGHWRGASIVAGRIFSAFGRDPKRVFDELCDLLRTTADRWRVRTKSPNLFVCEEIPSDSVALQPSSTADIPCIR